MLRYILDEVIEMNDNQEYEKVEALEIKEAKPKKTKGKFTQYLLVSILSLGFGFTGGYIANEINPKEVIYETKSIIEHTTVNTDNMSVQEVVAVVQDSVVQINVKVSTTGFLGQKTVQDSAGSGVIITADGYIVTNNHVIDGASEISVVLKDGSEYTASVVGSDTKSDLAVIKIDATDLTVATLGDSDNILVGDTAIAIGNPLGELGGTVTTGIISALDRQITIDNQPMNLLQTNAEINPGNSGGGLFNSKAELIGIVNAKTSATSIEGIGFAIPINDAKEIIEELITNGYVSNRATLGIYTQDVSANNQGITPGLYVAEVIENSAASEAGLQANDRIVSIDDTEISSYTDLSRILKNHKPGDSITVTVERNGEQIKLQATLTGTIVDE